MFSLFAHSVHYAKRIFWYSLLEWGLFFAVITVIAYYLQSFLAGGILVGLGYIGIGLIFLPLSQIRGVLLILGGTGALEVSKIWPSIRLLLRFWGAILPVPTAISLGLLVAIWQMGYVEFTPIAEGADQIAVAGSAFIQNSQSTVLHVTLLVIALIYTLTLSFNMVPISAIAANLGNSRADLDPFFGIGAYKFKALFMTLSVLALNILVIVVSAGLLYLMLADSIEQIALGQSAPTIGYGPAIIGMVMLVALIFIQNIWLSACALLFMLYQQDAKMKADEREAMMYGQVLDNNDLRALRKSREAR